MAREDARAGGPVNPPDEEVDAELRVVAEDVRHGDRSGLPSGHYPVLKGAGGKRSGDIEQGEGALAGGEKTSGPAVSFLRAIVSWAVGPRSGVSTSAGVLPLQAAAVASRIGSRGRILGETPPAPDF
jgi:hypothetical protein